jgi:hypothetical protein
MAIETLLDISSAIEIFFLISYNTPFIWRNASGLDLNMASYFS